MYFIAINLQYKVNGYFLCHAGISQLIVSHPDRKYIPPCGYTFLSSF